MFLLEPVSGFVVKNKPTTLQCRASNALQVYFSCNGERLDSKEHSSLEFVDPHTGTRVVEAELNVTRDHIEEYFGRDKFRCECVAWSSGGQIHSQPAFVDVACEYSSNN